MATLSALNSCLNITSIAIKDATYLGYYDVESNDELAFFGEDTSVQALHRDHLGDYHVYDADSSGHVIKVSETSYGQTIKIIDVEEPIMSLSNTRQIGLDVDSLGIVAYEEDFSYEITWVNKTCASRPGSIKTSITGGDFPHSVFSVPDAIRTTIIQYNGDDVKYC